MEAKYLTGEAGSAKLSDEVLETIASVAAGEIEGVNGVVAKAPVELGKKGFRINAKTAHKGVRILDIDGKIGIEANISVEYGCKLQEVAMKVQDNIYHSLETMTGIQPVRVVVNVVGVTVEEKKAD